MVNGSKESEERWKGGWERTVRNSRIARKEIATREEETQHMFLRLEV